MQAKYIAYDIETGGLSKEAPILTAAFIVLDERFETIAKTDFLFKLAKKVVIEPEAFAINKINIAEHFKNSAAMEATEIDERLEKWIRLHQTDGAEKLQSVGHSFFFDYSRLSPVLPKSFALVDRRGIDTSSNNKILQALGRMPKEANNLGEIAKHFGVEASGAHTATADTEMTIQVLRKQMALF